MILDGDILTYFESISVDVRYMEGGVSSFTFLVSYREFDLDCKLLLDHDESSISLVLELVEPKTFTQMAASMNALSLNTPFKAYFDRIANIVYVKGFSFVSEDNLVSTLDYFISSLVEEDYEYIENLYNSIYREDYQSIDEDSLDESDDDTSIEEDLEELMSLLNNV